jgi:DNA replication protein DnaC
MQQSRVAMDSVKTKAAVAAMACRWCHKAPRRSPESELCTDCARCSKPECGSTDGRFTIIGEQLLCKDHAEEALEAKRAEHERRELAKKFEAAGFYARHKDVAYERLEPAQQTAADMYLGCPDCTIIYSGPAGTGKTWTSVAVAKRLIVRGHTVRWMSVPWMFASLRDWMAENGRSEFKLTKYVDSLLAFDYVVLDDLGAHRATDWAVETLYLILERWENLNKQGGLIVTTNLTLEGISATFGDRIASRLAEGCRFIPMTGDDKRLRARRQA